MTVHGEIRPGTTAQPIGTGPGGRPAAIVSAKRSAAELVQRSEELPLPGRPRAEPPAGERAADAKSVEGGKTVMTSTPAGWEFMESAWAAITRREPRVLKTG